KVRESYSKAAELITQSLRNNPQPGRDWMNLAFYEAKLNHRAEAEVAMKSAEERGATSLQVQFKKAQVLALLGRSDEALTLILECMKKGLSKTDVELALDLGALRKDPRYIQATSH